MMSKMQLSNNNNVDDDDDDDDYHTSPPHYSVSLSDDSTLHVSTS